MTRSGVAFLVWYGDKVSPGTVDTFVPDSRLSNTPCYQTGRQQDTCRNKHRKDHEMTSAKRMICSPLIDNAQSNIFKKKKYTMLVQ